MAHIDSGARGAGGSFARIYGLFSYFYWENALIMV